MAATADLGRQPSEHGTRPSGRLRTLALALSALWLLACSTPEPVAAPPAAAAASTPPSASTAYVETGDLEALRARGALRVLAVAVPGAGCDVAGRDAAERELLALLGDSLDLDLVPLCVADAATLASALRAGRGDLA
ncbi:MAG TPA: hypothetical protein VIW02_08680, partial [Gammaproteobacteria bacterium]